MTQRYTLALAAFTLAVPAAAQVGDFTAGEPILAYNMALVPLYTRRPPPYADYTVLEEAQQNRALAVRELPGGAEVPFLHVSNKDKRDLYLLGGEVLLGGQQDRMVVRDTVVEAGRKERVNVVCVEAGRWSDGDLVFRSSGAVAHPELRRMALFQGQSDVWNEVARKSAASGVSSDTGTFRRVVQDAALRKRITSYLDEIQGAIRRDDTLAGLALAIDGEVEVVDLFDSPHLYRKLERKLLASYVLSALERQPKPHKDAARAAEKARKLNKNDVDGLMTKGAPSQLIEHKGKQVHGTYFKKEK